MLLHSRLVIIYSYFPSFVYNVFNLTNMSLRTCVNKTDNFCYICGEVTVKAHQKPLSSLVKKAYELCFACKVGDQDKSWAPKICCSSCSRISTGWLKGTHKSMPFAVPMVWREPRNHVNDCYFCMTNIKGITY